MRFSAGFLLGVSLTLFGIGLHDARSTFSGNTIVNRTNVVHEGRHLVEYFAARCDRLFKWVTFQY
jgi:hypothetical protein